METDIKKQAYLAFDTAYYQGMVTLFSRDGMLFAEQLSEKMSHAREICQAMARVVERAEALQFNIAGLYAGRGPGSFVGVRVALATAMGYSFAKDLPLFGFCSHLALAYSIEAAGNFYIFMKASGDLGYFAEYYAMNDTIKVLTEAQVISIEDLRVRVNPCVTVYSDVPEKLITSAPELIAKNLAGPTEQGIMRAALFARAHKTDSIKPNYIKPPNVSTAACRLAA